MEQNDQILTRNTSIVLDEEVKRQLMVLAGEWGVTVSAIIRMSISKFLKNPVMSSEVEVGAK